MNIAVSAEAEQVVREALAGRPHLVRLGLQQHVDTAARAGAGGDRGALRTVSTGLGMLTWVARRGSPPWSGLVPSLAVALSAELRVLVASGGT
ncbi:hypothetical protein [Nonomuraea sp. NPDC049709]|uniref:hypothetical protein n=1 Tax=Nonomuraea sp. NPDC049709 TaxID=3154736 RepID=UPI00342A6508